ncbi:MAG: aminopeptidase P family N-terminal domain-containing protein, partial [Anaerolineales bacterium]|nr:aminopeptidase P family N-terminal domain-containing protein [Anaerolineales bacterium]
MRHKSEPSRGFTTAEFEMRLTRAQRLMHEQDLAALWLTTEPEFRYFSGFLTQFWQSPTRPWFLVVPAQGKPMAVIPEIGAAYLATTWLDDIRTWPAPTPADDGVSLLLATLREVVGQSGRVGVLMGAETHLRMPLRDFETIRTILKEAGHEFADATPLIRELRLIKSAAEIEKIAHSCGLVSDSFAALPSFVTSGMTER